MTHFWAESKHWSDSSVLKVAPLHSNVLQPKYRRAFLWLDVSSEGRYWRKKPNESVFLTWFLLNKDEDKIVKTSWSWASTQVLAVQHIQSCVCEAELWSTRPKLGIFRMDWEYFSRRLKTAAQERQPLNLGHLWIQTRSRGQIRGLNQRISEGHAEPESY